MSRKIHVTKRHLVRLLIIQRIKNIMDNINQQLKHIWTYDKRVCFADTISMRPDLSLNKLVQVPFHLQFVICLT